VYNSAAHEIKRITIAEVNEIGLKETEEISLIRIICKPSVIMSKYQAWYYVILIFLHLIPGLQIDGLLKASGGEKPLYINIHCIIYVYIYVLLTMVYFPAAGIT
jgi:hypothetical protein